ncbi:hypothetical protein [Leclercia sp.]|uniref:hypothetical protein n=1 Tax=Leclercia sp. TaxID=1898428 RepID=UPI0028993EA7|nr:hypothetical protein [Leclercia sp.]
MDAFPTLVDHDNQTDTLLALTLAQEPVSRVHIPMEMDYLALTDPASMAISHQPSASRKRGAVGFSTPYCRCCSGFARRAANGEGRGNR